MGKRSSLSYAFAVYDEDGERLETFETEREARDFAASHPEARSIAYVPLFDPDDNPDRVNWGEYEDFEVIWENEREE